MLQFVKHLKRWLSGGTRLLFQKLTLVDIKAGKGFYPRPSFYVARGFKVRIGDNVYIGRCAHIAADVTIGNDVLIASSVSIVGGEHVIDGKGDLLIRESGKKKTQTTIIENDVWIGHGCIIRSGVRMKKGSVLAAGAVLTKDVGEDEVWGGVPAKLIRKRNR